MSKNLKQKTPNLVLVRGYILLRLTQF